MDTEGIPVAMETSNKDTRVNTTISMLTITKNTCISSQYNTILAVYSWTTTILAVLYIAGTVAKLSIETNNVT